ncbi:MAG TPA: threonine ammonia-lyase IlvA, partial [Cytophagales bacterium]|nr:threonine ammonia-lyase IlvA [Cytophagales bacterium]
MTEQVSAENILKALERLKPIVTHTPLQKNSRLSERYKCNIYLKREDLQVVRSYKIRGAYNFISSCSNEELSKGIVCSSAGNHAQGVAFACAALKIKGYIYMPSTTPKQKVTQVRMFGKEHVEVVLVGDTYDDSYAAALEFCNSHGMKFCPPFDHPRTIEGQGTVGVEILQDIDVPLDYIFMPIGGGGLVSGVSTYFKHASPHTQIIGVEPAGAPAMHEAFKQGKVVTLEHIDKFVDGAAVKRVGDFTFEIARKNIDDIVLVPEGKVCSTIIKLYNEEAIVVEPAGALSISALDFYKDQIVGKNVVCIVSGSNNDLARMNEIKERSLTYEGLQHYFIISFPQRAGALRNFLDNVLGPNDDIIRFE